MPLITHLTPDDLYDTGVFNNFERIVLAQGDSWFSIGAVPPFATSNLIFNMDLARKTCVVVCARPGATLVNMVDWMERDAFGRNLSGNLATRWNGIFLSAGGNDLINAVQVPPVLDGASVPPDKRLLRTQHERGADPQPTPAGYVSEPGWQTFRRYLMQNFSTLVSRREQGPNQGVPIFFHTYDYLLPRNAPAFIGFGPWLWNAVRDYGVPEQDWAALGKELIDRFAALLGDIIVKINDAYKRDMGLHLVDTRGILIAAAAGSPGTSHDWINEIHPTSDGYRKLDVRWKQVVDPIMG